MANARLDKIESMTSMLAPMCRKLWFASIPTRQKCIRAICESCLMYGMELWLFDKDPVWRSRTVLGILGTYILGNIRTSNRTIALLESGGWEPMVSAIARRATWIKRILDGSDSPARVLLATAVEEYTPTVMFRIVELNQICGIRDDYATRLGTPDREMMLIALTKRVYRNANYFKVEDYLNMFWNRSISFSYSKGNANVIRWIHWLRMDCFAHWGRMKRYDKNWPEADGCGWCRNPSVQDNRTHMLMYCTAWKTERELYIRPLLIMWNMNYTYYWKSGEQTVVERLLGGRAAYERDWTATLEAMIKFMKALMATRKILSKHLKGV